MNASPTSYTCPRCNMISHSPQDAQQGYYRQALSTLNLAWDVLREDGDVDPQGPPRGRTVDITRIMDVAITAYRWRGKVTGTCRHCGDGTEVDEDPDPELCWMCQKAGRT